MVGGYYYVIKHREQVPATDGAAGRIIIPSGVQAIAIERRHIRPKAQANAQTMLFDSLEGGVTANEPDQETLLDPAVYLAGLSCHTASKVCSNLVGYPWFKRVVPEEYDSGRISQNDYRKRIEAKIDDLWQGLPEGDDAIARATDAAVEFQVSVGCDAIILPSPLTIDPGTDYTAEIQWLDRGLAAAASRSVGVSTLATVALSDICTFSAEPSTNRLLDILLDHVTAREPGGVYLVLEQRVDQGYYVTSTRTLRTLLRLVSEFKEAGIERVLVSWTGLAGFLSLAAGADGWVSGWYRSERRLKLDDFRDDSGGLAAAALYSHQLCGDIHPSDLERMRDAGMLSLVEDETPATEPLFKALRAGRNVKDVALWTNEAARAHFNTVAIRETSSMLRRSPRQRIEHARRWLKGASELASQVAALRSLHDRTTVSHQSAWRSAFDVWATPTNDDTNRTHSGD